MQHRQRTLSPGFFLNEQLLGLTPLHRLLFAGLWTIADREGRLEDRPLRIKLQVLPIDACDVASMLVDLDRVGLIERYEVGGRELIAIPTWSNHQHPHHKEKASILPPPGAKKHRPRQVPAPTKASADPAGSTGSTGSSGSSGSTETSPPSGGDPSVPVLGEDLKPAKKPAELVLQTWARATKQPAAVMGKTDWAIIGARLKEGFTVEQLQHAAEGVRRDAWDGRSDHAEVKYVFGDAGTVRKFLKLHEQGPAFKPGGFHRADHYTAEDRGPKGEIDPAETRKQLGWNDLDEARALEVAERKPANLVIKPTRY